MGVIESIDITAKQRKRILSLLKKYLPDTEVWVYGSRVKWNARPQSDLDIVVFTTPEKKLQVSSLKEAFEESDLPFRVDLFIWDEVPEQFRENIESEHVVLQEKAEKANVNGWIREKVGNVAYTNTDTYSLQEDWEYVNYLDTGNITDGSIASIQRIDSGDKLPVRAQRKIQKGDIIYSTVRPVQRHYGLISFPVKNMLVSTGFVVIRGNSKKCDTTFLYYFLTQKSVVEKLQTIAEHSTSAYPSIRPSDIESLDITFPSLPEQRAIAHILGSLDYKIELNRRINETLEGMAQALFKSWFIDFDPMIDNALAAGNPIPEELQLRVAMRESLGDARKPLPEDIRTRFPDEFAFTNEMGWIPKGWVVKSLGELIHLIGGGTPKTSVTEYWNGNIPWFSVVDAPSASDLFVIDTEKHITQLGVDKSSTQILPVGSTIISATGTVGKCAMVGEPMAMNQSCYGIRGREGISDSFIYYTIRERVAELQRGGHGSVFNTITRDTFKTIKIPFDNAEITQKLEERIKPSFDRILANCCQSKDLALLRDTLLTKLLTGEIRVSEAAKMVEATV